MLIFLSTILSSIFIQIYQDDPDQPNPNRTNEPLIVAILFYNSNNLFTAYFLLEDSSKILIAG